MEWEGLLASGIRNMIALLDTDRVRFEDVVPFYLVKYVAMGFYLYDLLTIYLHLWEEDFLHFWLIQVFKHMSLLCVKEWIQKYLMPQDQVSCSICITEPFLTSWNMPNVMVYFVWHHIYWYQHLFWTDNTNSMVNLVMQQYAWLQNRTCFIYTYQHLPFHTIDLAWYSFHDVLQNVELWNCHQ